MKAYQKHFPVSLPEEDHDDRNALYAMLVKFVAVTINH